MKRESELVIPVASWLAEAEARLAAGNTVLLRVAGNSMLPFMRSERDSVVLTPVCRVQPGDIVLAKLSTERYVLHRVVRTGRKGMLLKGDGNLRQTEACRYDQVCGRVSHIVRAGRRISVDARGERMRVALWRALRPFHRLLLAAYRRLLLKHPFYANL